MLKRILTQKRYLKNIYKAQKGITGLETAIILIAFVVVAAVFAYTVLSAGLFSTQKSQEAVYTGLQQTQNTMELKSSVLTSNTLGVVDDCSSAWAGGTPPTVTTYDGVPCLRFTLAADTSVSSYVQVTGRAGTVSFWAALGNTADSGLVTFAVGPANTLLRASTSITGTDTKWHKFTRVTLGTDTYIGVKNATANAGNFLYVTNIAIDAISLYSTTDPMVLFANQAVFSLGLANGGEPVDFTGGTDTDSDGRYYYAAGYDAAKTNKVVINYSDKNQQVSDIAWTGSFIGKHNGSGNLLADGDKIQLTVDLTYINLCAASANKIGPDHKFTLEVKTSNGAVLTIQRTMPDRLHAYDDLN